MKISMLFLFLSIQISLAGTYAQTEQISLDISNKPIDAVLDEIEQKTDFHFFYNTKQIDLKVRVSLKVQNKNIFDILNILFKDRNIAYTVLDKNIVLSIKKKGEPINKRKISGTVTDTKGEPVIGATILVKGTNTGTISNIDGEFSLYTDSNAPLVVTYVGCTKQEVPTENKSILNIVLQDNVKSIGEVVVTALGIKREEKALGYSVQKVTGDAVETVKGVDVSSALTGKVSGLNVTNSTEFNDAPQLFLRGQSPLLVIDGIPYASASLRDISADDIESIDVLKGATASALYGARGGVGAIMVTTKKAKQEGLSVTVNSSTMFDSGFLKFPEVQTAYSSGSNGKYKSGDFVWGDKLDIGRTATLYNPNTYEWEANQPLVSKGRNNFQNFLQLSLVTNNNISVAQKGKYGSFRTSLTHVFNKGQYPNTSLNKIIYSLNGELKYKGFEFQGGLRYNNRFYPNNTGVGYGTGGYLYSLLIWQGAEYDVRDFRNYWVKENEKQNWTDKSGKWYDNPYFIANEITHSDNYHITNGFMTGSYQITNWLKTTARVGLDVYSRKEEWTDPLSSVGGRQKNGGLGAYEQMKKSGMSINADFLLMANKKFGKFQIDGFVGGTIYYNTYDQLYGKTKNGLSLPGYYSLKASTDPAEVSSTIHSKQVNSIYAKASFSWDNYIYIDVTGRNDWSSTLPSETRSYFYPSVAGSLIISELLPAISWLDMWKVRSSWTQTKKDLGVYDTNNDYTIIPKRWDSFNGASFPSSIRGVVSPQTANSTEIGTNAHFLHNRVYFDFTYYRTRSYNFTREANISDASGFGKTLVNTDEELMRKGFEVTMGGTPVKTKDFSWTAMFNWSTDKYYYYKIDPVYSTQKPWIKENARWDWVGIADWERDPQGNIVHQNGYPVLSKYTSKIGTSSPDWIWGLTNTLKYKNFTLSFSFDGRVGGIAYSYTNQAMWNSGTHIDSDNQYRYEEVVNGKKTFIGQGVEVVSGNVSYDANGNILSDNRVFQPNNRIVSYEAYQKAYHPTAWQEKRQNFFDQTFIKLRDISITYDIPKSICKKMKMTGASIAFIGNNVWLWTKEFRFSDPDGINFMSDPINGGENMASPSLRMLGFNVKLNF